MDSRRREGSVPAFAGLARRSAPWPGAAPSAACAPVPWEGTMAEKTGPGRLADAAAAAGARVVAAFARGAGSVISEQLGEQAREWARAAPLVMTKAFARALETNHGPYALRAGQIDLYRRKYLRLRGRAATRVQTASRRRSPGTAHSRSSSATGSARSPCSARPWRRSRPTCGVSRNRLLVSAALPDKDTLHGHTRDADADRP